MEAITSANDEIDIEPLAICQTKDCGHGKETHFSSGHGACRLTECKCSTYTSKQTVELQPEALDETKCSEIDKAMAQDQTVLAEIVEEHGKQLPASTSTSGADFDAALAFMHGMD